MINNLLTEESESKILGICKDLVNSGEIVAACFYGPLVHGYADEKGDVNILLVIRSPQSVLKSRKERVNGISTLFLIVDQGTFEKDVETGWLGELIVENIIMPYKALLNEGYLWHQEVKAKKRLVSELVGNLVLEFPELSYDLLIKPEYFIFETVSRRSSLFPPMAYSFLNMLRKDLKEKNIESMMKGFNAALTELTEEGRIDFYNGFLKIKKDYIDAVKAKKPSLMNLFRSIRKESFRQILRAFPKTMLPPLKDQETYTALSINLKNFIEEPLFKLEDSKRYLFVPTPLGLVALSDKTTIEDFVKKAVPKGRATEMSVKKIGGVLNSVYLLTFHGEQRRQRTVVKLFKDWYGLKWFPLALWALGTRGFSVLGKSRLEKEYAINRLLFSQGIRVPEVLYVSPKERLIFEEFIEGWNLIDVLKKFAAQKIEADETRKIIRDVGRAIATVHKVGVALGDCKPENMVVTPKGEVCFLDLEQASRGGDQTWDIAEFLFYTGHYFPLFFSPEAAKMITTEFLEGYLEAEGNVEKVRKAGSARYIKVFSFFTPPHILIAILNTCKKILKSKSDRLQKNDQTLEGS